MGRGYPATPSRASAMSLASQALPGQAAHQSRPVHLAVQPSWMRGQRSSYRQRRCNKPVVGIGERTDSLTGTVYDPLSVLIRMKPAAPPPLPANTSSPDVIVDSMPGMGGVLANPPLPPGRTVSSSHGPPMAAVLRSGPSCPAKYTHPPAPPLAVKPDPGCNSTVGASRRIPPPEPPPPPTWRAPKSPT